MQTQLDINIIGTRPLITPSQLRQSHPLPDQAVNTVAAGRLEIRRLLSREDQRLLVIAGPCSIHDPHAAIEYAHRLVELRHRYSDRLAIQMRVYFEKPRTTVGWKGLINDPYLDGSCRIEDGLALARQLLADINTIGLPAATEFLDPIVPQYLSELVSWAAIGARTTESQTHREMASGLSMPVGFKNGTDGSLQIALDAMIAAGSPHTFLGIDSDGHGAIMQTRGNKWGHIVLRGGSKRTNYDHDAIAETRQRLRSANLPENILVDCSHANSGKKHENQAAVLHAVLAQHIAGQDAILGVMLESNLHSGAQKLNGPLNSLRHGVSVTDECIGWDTTAELLAQTYHTLALQPA